MRALPWKLAPTQESRSAGLSQPGRALAANPFSSLLPDRSRALEDRAAGQRPRAPDGSSSSESSRPGHDFSRIPIHDHPRAAIQPAVQVDTSQNERERTADRRPTWVIPILEPHAHDLSRVTFGIQRKSLEVSRPTDADERQADEWAQRVVSGQAPALPSGHGSTRATPAEAAHELPSTLERCKGGGRPLDGATRGEMEARMGTGLRNVMIHTGTEAHALSARFNAAAFTYGQDVFFGRGEFDANSAQGKGLLAHELTHTVQNRGRPARKIQRKILVGADPYTPTAEDYETYDKGLLDRLHNGGNEPEHRFATMDEFQHEVGIRTNVMKAVLNVIDENNTSVRFGFSDYEAGEFRLPEEYWVRKNRKEYHLKQGMIGSKAITPAAAVDAIFNNGELQTYLDCNMMLIAIQYKAMLDTYGPERFNKMFPGGAGLIIGQNKEDNPATSDVKEGYASTTSGKHPLFDQALFTRIDVAEGEDALAKLLPGDWVYFKNASDYLELLDRYNQAMVESTLDPGRYPEFRHYAEWQGEHAIYVGERTIEVQGADQKAGTSNGFTGFGLSRVESYEGMINQLLAACKFEYNSLQLAKNNDFTTDPNDISKVPDSVITGKPRISAIFRLNTKNIEPLGK